MTVQPFLVASHMYFSKVERPKSCFCLGAAAEKDTEVPDEYVTRGPQIQQSGPQQKPKSLKFFQMTEFMKVWNPAGLFGRCMALE